MTFGELIKKTAGEAQVSLASWVVPSIYGISSCFFLVNFYSFGFSYSFLTLALLSLFLGPLLGALQLLLDAYLLRAISRAPFTPLLAAITWSKVPYCITLCMWLIFMGQDTSTIFLHVGSRSSDIYIILVSLAVNLWSFLLLTKAVKALQSISFSRALFNVSISSLLSFSLICFFMFISRFIFLV